MRNRLVRSSKIALLVGLLCAFTWVLYQSEEDSPRFLRLLVFVLVSLVGSAIIFVYQHWHLRTVERDLQSQGLLISEEEPEPFFLPARRRSDTVAGIIALVLIVGIFVAHWLGFRL